MRRLLGAWSGTVGLDIVEQAQQFAAKEQLQSRARS
jgi:hypothetical protein